MGSRKSSIAQLEEANTSLTSTLEDQKSVIDQEPKEIKKDEPYTIFSTYQQIRFLSICALTGMISPLTASIYVPALVQIQEVSTYNLI
jgi:hypothetical protein